MHHRFSPGACLPVLLVFAALWSSAHAGSAVSWKGSLLVEQGYDSNVFLESQGPRADEHSWVTSITPQVSSLWKLDDQHTAGLTYAPTLSWFSDADSENNVAHRISASSTYLTGPVTWQFTGSDTIIDGSGEGLIWSGAGGAPATGAPALRDRRDQAVLRATLRAIWKSGAWCLRPLVNYYAVDFQTAQRTTAGYQNYVDRSEIVLGCDALRDFGKFQAGLSYRRGRQDQVRLFQYPEEYDNSFHRALVLLEGKPAPWLTAAIQAGPEFRHYGDRVPTTLRERDRLTAYADATLTVAVSRSDAVILSGRRFEMVSSSGRGAFDDLNVDAAWRHDLSKHASVTLGFHAYNTAFLPPARRDDWVLTWRISGSVTLTEAWKCDATFLHDTALSQVPDTAAREYSRAMCSVSVRRAF